jgi:DnaK suppressor protein
MDDDSDHARLERARNELDDVGAALAGLDDGTYGTCQVCGQRIDEARLAMLPTARFCVHHQEVADKSVGPASGA